MLHGGLINTIAHPGIIFRTSQHKPTISPLPDPIHNRITWNTSCTDPYRNPIVCGPRIDPILVDRMESPTEGHRCLRPKLAQHFQLFLTTGTSGAKVDTHCFVLRFAATNTNTQPDSALSENI